MADHSTCAHCHHQKDATSCCGQHKSKQAKQQTRKGCSKHEHPSSIQPIEHIATFPMVDDSFAFPLLPRHPIIFMAGLEVQCQQQAFRYFPQPSKTHAMPPSHSSVFFHREREHSIRRLHVAIHSFCQLSGGKLSSQLVNQPSRREAMGERRAQTRRNKYHVKVASYFVLVFVLALVLMLAREVQSVPLSPTETNKLQLYCCAVTEGETSIHGHLTSFYHACMC